MATYGKAREATIQALRNCEPFERKGFAMKGVKGAVSSLGRLDTDYQEMYRKSASQGCIEYTVVSYLTPIAWVLSSGAVIIPSDRYSNTTTHHQSMCRVYLNS
jgi:hypothetical protein